jgi:Mg-chelatase subunit ChlD
MRFATPYFLPLLVLLLWFWRTSRLSAAHHPRRAAVRCAAAALVVLAMSRMEIRLGDAPMTAAFVVDVSNSMREPPAEVLRRADALRRELEASDRAGLIVFAGVPQIERPVGGAARPFAELTADVPRGATDLEAALRTARLSMPSGGLRRIVVLSDGYETKGDALREAAAAASQGIAIDAAPPAFTGRPAMRVARLAAPGTVRAGQPFSVTAIVEGPPGAAGDLVIEGSGGRSASRHIEIGSDGSAAVTVPASQSSAGTYVYRAAVRETGPVAQFAPTDEPPQGAVVVVADQPRVLHVASNRGTLAGDLSGAYRLDYSTPSALPGTASGLRSYDAVILDDVPAADLSTPQIEALAQHVRDYGAGLLVLGSARSLDAGLFPDRSLGKLLPIDLRPRSGQRAPDMALVVVYDKSGSMDDRVDGVARIEFAREGIQKLVDVLPAGDALGVIAFDSEPTPVLPLGEVQAARDLTERLRAIQPGGGTAMAPAIELAARWLSTGDGGRFTRRHVLLISDGQSSASDAARVKALVAQGRFELSVVALGRDSDRRVLAGLAESSGGRAYLPAHIRELPEIVAREGARMAGGHVLEQPFTPRTVPHSVTAGLDLRAMPSLGGYVVSAPRPNAEMFLRSHVDDPVLAAWSHGLGKVAVYTADLRGEWSAPLRRWREWPRLLTRAVGWVARPAPSDALYTRIQPAGDAIRLIVEAGTPAGDHISRLVAGASLRTPAGETVDRLLKETRPGRYEGEIPILEAGPYLVNVEARSREGTFDGRVLRGFYWSDDAEGRLRGVNRAVLDGLAQATGGRVLRPGETWMGGERRPPSFADVRSFLLVAAFLLFLSEVVIPLLPGLTARSGTRHVRREAA